MGWAYHSIPLQVGALVDDEEQSSRAGFDPIETTVGRLKESSGRSQWA